MLDILVFLRFKDVIVKSDCKYCFLMENEEYTCGWYIVDIAVIYG